MSKTKGGGSTRNGRDSQAQRLGVKRFDGQAVTATGVSKGKGFQGTIKRHNFGRGPETHGSHNVRQPGSIGASAYPSRVFKGMRMSGHMGAQRVTQQGLKIVRRDVENNLLLIKGAIPGSVGSLVFVKSAAKGATL